MMCEKSIGEIGHRNPLGCTVYYQSGITVFDNGRIVTHNNIDRCPTKLATLAKVAFNSKANLGDLVAMLNEKPSAARRD